MSIRGVITADIIDSTQIPLKERQELIESIMEVMDELKKSIELEYELYRGDSIQVVVERPEKALLAAIAMRAGVKSRTPQGDSVLWDMRTSIGIGETEFISENIAVSDGEAFRFSGRGLDKIGKSTISVLTPWDDVNKEFSVSVPFADEIVRGWNENQAAQVFLSLIHDKSRKDIADQMGISAQAVSKTLISAKEKLIRNLISRFETVITGKTDSQCQ